MVLGWVASCRCLRSLLQPKPPGLGFRLDLSMALGFAGLAMKAVLCSSR
jgi:hypothetical protein